MITISVLILIVMIMASMAFFTLLERKILGYSQLRKGPNKVTFQGLTQPAADGIKLFTKETTKLLSANKLMFYISPIMGLALAMMFWSMLPTSSSNLYMNFPLIMFLCISSLSVYPIMLAGWTSNSKYSLLGSLRSVSQTISYEISMSLTLLAALMLLKSFKMTNIISNTMFSVMLITPIIMFIWFSTTLAETNRSPYDLAEGESELVSGFNTEYGGPEFALIFMAEYMNIMFMSSLTSVIFFVSNNLWPLLFTMKTMVIATLFITIRASLPRLRYDRLMAMTWTSYLPVSLLMMFHLSFA